MVAKILVVAPRTPKPDTASGDLRFFFILRMLAKNNQVDMCVTLDNPHAPNMRRYKQDLQEIGVNVLKHKEIGLELAVLRRPYDIVLFEFWYCAEPYIQTIRSQQPWAKIVVDTVDIHFLREEASIALGMSEQSVVSQRKQQELKVYQQADLTLVVTPEDHDALVLEKVTTPVALVPNIVSVRPREKKERSQVLLFIGGFYHAPNTDGLLWFVHECWPQIRTQVPEATLIVVGSNATPEILALDDQEGIQVAGFVPETTPYLDQARVSIAPLRFGAGMKGKVTEAMAAGLPVVTTTVGSQGLNAVSDKHLMICDDPVEFAKAVVMLVSEPDRAEALGAAAQEHIKQLCSAEVVEKQLNMIIDSLLTSAASERSSYSMLTLLGYRTSGFGKVGLLCLRKVVEKVFKQPLVPKHLSGPAA